jgi:hypothetical protein
MKKLLFGFFVMAALANLASCTDNNNTTPTPNAQVKVVHASPDAPNVDVTANGNTVVNNLAFRGSTPYAQLAPGQVNIQVRPTGSTTAVINATVPLLAGTSYSVFAINPVASIGAAVTVDDLATPAQGRAHVRFFHFSPGAPAVTVGVVNGPDLFTNRSFNDQNSTTSLQAFTPVNAGTYNLAVRLASGGTVVLNVPNVNLEAGKIYTVYARGIVGNATTPLGADIIVHN